MIHFQFIILLILSVCLIDIGSKDKQQQREEKKSSSSPHLNIPPSSPIRDQKPTFQKPTFSSTLPTSGGGSNSEEEEDEDEDEKKKTMNSGHERFNLHDCCDCCDCCCCCLYSYLIFLFLFL